MAVRFIIGRAGSGKTRHCFDAIVAACAADPLGPPIFWIVPRQATFNAERELTCNSTLRGFSRVRVVSFEQLATLVLAECGGTCMPEVTAAGRQMILAHLLRKHERELQFFRGVARQPGLARTLDATFAEFERAGQKPGDVLARLQGDADRDPDALLSPKLHDVRLIYDRYVEFLGQDRLDPHRRIERVVQLLPACKLIRGAAVYVDRFLDYAESERQLLCGLAKSAAGVDITALLDPASPAAGDPHLQPAADDPFHRTTTAFHRLWLALRAAGATVHAPRRLEAIHRFHPALARIEHELFNPTQTVNADATAAVTLIEAADISAEVDAAARFIVQRLRDGLRLRDITVLVRDLGPYADAIDASFREHGIPYFADRRRSAAHHPLLAFMRSALVIARRNWPNDAAISLLKSGLAGLDSDAADAIEDYVLEHRIRGEAGWTDAKPWAYRHAAHGEDERDSASIGDEGNIERWRRDVIYRLLPFATSVGAPGRRPLRAFATDLFHLLDAFDVRDTLQRWIDKARGSQQHERAAEHERVWAEFVGLIDQMVDLLGDEPATLAEFMDVLESGLEQFDLALTPPTVDQVLVGEIDRTRAPAVRAALVLGMADGSFPRTPREDSILSDADRRLLNDRDVTLRAETKRQLLDERLLAYLAFTRASEVLYASRPLATEGSRPMSASPFWEALVSLFPTTRVRKFRVQTRDAPSAISTPRQLVGALMRWVRQPTGDEQATWAALYQWLANRPCDGGPIDRARRTAWRALQYRNDASLDVDTARQLFRSPLDATVRQLETFAACPFQHFVRHGLRLRRREAHDVTGVDLSNVYHDVLEQLTREILREGKELTRVPRDELDRRAALIARRVGERLRGEIMLDSARNKHVLTRIERALEEVLDAQRAAEARGKFRPAAAGVKFGGSAAAQVRIGTPRGNTVALRGELDRIDTLPGDHAAAAIDYKLAAGSLSVADAVHGLSLQLLSYLLVLQSAGAEILGHPVTPTAALHLPLTRRMRDAKHPDDAHAPDSDDFALRVPPTGIVSADYARDFDCNAPPNSKSLAINVRFNSDGSVGRVGIAKQPEELRALMAFVGRRIGELADEILSGDVAVRPYRLGTDTPCSGCGYRDVCRFDPTLDAYHHLQPLDKAEAMARVQSAGAGAGER